jgi:hypothetical protein
MEILYLLAPFPPPLSLSFILINPKALGGGGGDYMNFIVNLEQKYFLAHVYHVPVFTKNNLLVKLK